IRVDPALPDEIGKLRNLYVQRVDLSSQLIDELKPRVLVRFGEGYVERDDPGAVTRERVDERRNPRSRPRPTSLGLDALFVDRRQHYGRLGRDRAAGAESQVEPVQLDPVENRSPGCEKKYDDGNRPQGQPYGIEQHRLELRRRDTETVGQTLHG